MSTATGIEYFHLDKYITKHHFLPVRAHLNSAFLFFPVTSRMTGIIIYEHFMNRFLLPKTADDVIDSA